MRRALSAEAADPATIADSRKSLAAPVAAHTEETAAEISVKPQAKKRRKRGTKLETVVECKLNEAQPAVTLRRVTYTGSTWA